MRTRTISKKPSEQLEIIKKRIAKKFLKPVKPVKPKKQTVKPNKQTVKPKKQTVKPKKQTVKPKKQTVKPVQRRALAKKEIIFKQTKIVTVKLPK